MNKETDPDLLQRWQTVGDLECALCYKPAGTTAKAAGAASWAAETKREVADAQK